MGQVILSVSVQHALTGTGERAGRMPHDDHSPYWKSFPSIRTSLQLVTLAISLSDVKLLVGLSRWTL